MLTVDKLPKVSSAAELEAVINEIGFIPFFNCGLPGFSVKAICDKVDMQLVLYAAAAAEMAKNGLYGTGKSLTPQISAIFYSKIGESESQKITIDKLYEEVNGANQKFDGLIVLDREDNSDDSSPYLKNSIFSMDSSLLYSNESDFLNVKLNKDGSLNKKSDVQSRKDFEIMVRYIKKAAVDTDKNIRSGNISIKPYGGDGSPCKYCAYSEVCMFDSNLDGCRNPVGTDDVISYMEQEVAENE